MARTRGLPRAVVLLGLLASTPPAGAWNEGNDGAAAPAPLSDAAVLARIEALRPKAAAIVVDGKGADWEGIPSFADPAGDAGEDPGRDILRVALAPREDDLVARVALAGPPPAAGHFLWLDFDFTGHAARDLRVGVAAVGPPMVRFYPEGKPPSDVHGLPVRNRVGEVVEVRVPLEIVSRLLGPEELRAWTGGQRRSWVRLRTYTLSRDGKTFVDHGPAVGSFRLVQIPGPLDPPPPRATRAARAVPLPVQGQWFVRQGAFGLWSHRTQWAYDLGRVNDALQASRSGGSRDNADYFSFGERVRAPEGGTVAAARDDLPDNPPLDEETAEPGARGRSNDLLLRLDDGFLLFFAHLRKGSLSVEREEKVAAGATLGQVGNSGDSKAPHLHLALYEAGEGGGLVDRPLALRDVRVGLNPGAGDPWARDLPSWDLREGWFVEGEAPRPTPGDGGK